MLCGQVNGYGHLKEKKRKKKRRRRRRRRRKMTQEIVDGALWSS